MHVFVTLGANDAGEVFTLQRAAYVSEAQRHDDLDLPPLRQPLDEVRAELVDPGVLALGHRDGHGRLVAAVRVRLDPAAGVGHLGRLTVAPDRQRQGLGRALMRAVETRLGPGIGEVRLFTGEHSHGNLRLYRALGYEETGRVAIPAGYDLVHLRKRVAPAAPG